MIEKIYFQWPMRQLKESAEQPKLEQFEPHNKAALDYSTKYKINISGPYYCKLVIECKNNGGEQTNFPCKRFQIIDEILQEVELNSL